MGDQALISSPKSYKSPNLVTLFSSNFLHDSKLDSKHADHALLTLRRKLTIGERITVWLVSSSTYKIGPVDASLHTNNNIFSFLLKSIFVKL